jgi:hypothetical protein
MIWGWFGDVDKARSKRLGEGSKRGTVVGWRTGAVIRLPTDLHGHVGEQHGLGKCTQKGPDATIVGSRRTLHGDGWSRRVAWTSDRHAGLASASLDEHRTSHPARRGPGSLDDRLRQRHCLACRCPRLINTDSDFSPNPNRSSNSNSNSPTRSVPTDKTRVLSRVRPVSESSGGTILLGCLVSAVNVNSSQSDRPSSDTLIILPLHRQALPRTVSTHLGWRLATRDSRHST